MAATTTSSPTSVTMEEPYALDHKVSSLRQSISMKRNTSNLTSVERIFVDEIMEEGDEEDLEVLLTTLEDQTLFFGSSHGNGEEGKEIMLMLEPPTGPQHLLLRGQRGSILRQQTIEKRRSCHQRNSLWRRSSMKKMDSFGSASTNERNSFSGGSGEFSVASSSGGNSIKQGDRSSSKVVGPQSLFTLDEFKELEASYGQDEEEDHDENGKIGTHNETKVEELVVPQTTSSTDSSDLIKRASRNIYLGEGFEVGAEDLFNMYSQSMPDYDPWRDNLEMDEEGHRFDFTILGTSPDDIDSQPHALSPPQMYALQEHLPMARKGESFWLKYSMVRDGASFSALLQHVRGSHHTVMCMETIDGEVFGAFSSTTWSIQPNYFGNGECFLWRMKSNRAEVNGLSLYEQAQQESDIAVYPYAYRNDYYQLCQHDRIGLGGGTASVPQEIQGEMVEPNQLGFGIMFEGSNLLEASSAPCLTFGSPSLSMIHSDGSKFELVNLEVWALTPCVTIEEARRLECQRLFLKRNLVNSNSTMQ
ncbi:unnamed protein product [Cylindrotheca closterium]|uniref:Oxidation resistance protein 1 n=1 Tax=Cylindrotheca closterium TaxID=2856 RepID=A0AAD2FXT9_9STRA|nr:unnamed protein product [Cylindrotheca closterium]